MAQETAQQEPPIQPPEESPPEEPPHPEEPHLYEESAKAGPPGTPLPEDAVVHVLSDDLMTDTIRQEQFGLEMGKGGNRIWVRIGESRPFPLDAASKEIPAKFLKKA